MVIHRLKVGTLPPVGALEQSQAEDRGDGFVGRVRTNPRLAVAIAAVAILAIAWIGWAIYVTGNHGPQAGLGVVIAWPAMIVALGIASLPFIGGYLVIRRLSRADEGSDGEGEADSRTEPEAAKS